MARSRRRAVAPLVDIGDLYSCRGLVSRLATHARCQRTPPRGCFRRGRLAGAVVGARGARHALGRGVLGRAVRGPRQLSPAPRGSPAAAAIPRLRPRHACAARLSRLRHVPPRNVVGLGADRRDDIGKIPWGAGQGLHFPEWHFSYLRLRAHRRGLRLLARTQEGDCRRPRAARRAVHRRYRFRCGEPHRAPRCTAPRHRSRLPAVRPEGRPRGGSYCRRARRCAVA